MFLMKITIVSVGKLKEKYWRDAENEYSKRLSRFCSLDVIEVQEEACSDNPSDSIIEKVKLKEGKRILSKIKPDSYAIILDLRGNQLDSVSFANLMQEQTSKGKSNFTFVIGGSYGLSEDVIKRGNMILSMSKMTFPHQMARIILLEQIYRAMKINSCEVYHK